MGPRTLKAGLALSIAFALMMNPLCAEATSIRFALTQKVTDFPADRLNEENLLVKKAYRKERDYRSTFVPWKISALLSLETLAGIDNGNSAYWNSWFGTDEKLLRLIDIVQTTTETQIEKPGLLRATLHALVIRAHILTRLIKNGYLTIAQNEFEAMTKTILSLSGQLHEETADSKAEEALLCAVTWVMRESLGSEQPLSSAEITRFQNFSEWMIRQAQNSKIKTTGLHLTYQKFLAVAVLPVVVSVVLLAAAGTADAAGFLEKDSSLLQLAYAVARDFGAAALAGWSTFVIQQGLKPSIASFRYRWGPIGPVKKAIETCARLLRGGA